MTTSPSASRWPFDLRDAPPILPLISPRTADGMEDVIQALSTAGVAAVEVALRHAGAIEALRHAARTAPRGIIVGAGTVRTFGQLEEAVDAGAAFVVSPGLDEELVVRASERHVPCVPGVATASEVMAAARLGLRVLKFFPAEASGGAVTLKALGEPFPDIAFIPTGGIDESNLARYLSLANVWCCGGSWIVPASELATGDVGAIAARVEQARSIAANAAGDRANRRR
ncbi:MAG: bifunctional 4-hydroxy-2-oxoglutarate aldolase/2-dehydro-3-deoxy-phosphogluconate aldolase [Candidatus Limnocylindria bacterium]